MKIKKGNKKSGFTLLEIIVVIIIVGVLAGLALPRFFSTIEFSRSTEAMNALGVMKRGASNCAELGGAGTDYQGCATLDAVGFTDPGANAHFTYSINDNLTGATAGTIGFEAKRNVVDGGDGSSTITLTLDASNGQVTKVGTGPFAGIK